MTVHKFKQPHMIYEGPRPRRAAVEPSADHTAPHVGEIHLDVPGGASQNPAFGIVLLVAVTLAVGIGLGFWISPSLRPAAAILPPEPVPAAALAPSRPAEAPPAVIEAAPAPVVEAIEEPRDEPVAAPARPKPAARAAERPLKSKVLARNDVAAAPRIVGGCRPDGSRAEVTICADPSIAAADEEMQRAFQRALRSGAPSKTLRAEQKDWLVVREQAARRSPSDLASAYEARVNELNTIADDPPH